MNEAWYYFFKHLITSEPTVEPENPAVGAVWKEADDLYWWWIDNRWANIITGEFRK